VHAHTPTHNVVLFGYKEEKAMLLAVKWMKEVGNNHIKCNKKDLQRQVTLRFCSYVDL
jgi:hypothetical protein